MAPSASEQQRPKRPRFWVGPMVAGACFALGYGITQRVVLMRAAWKQPQQETFRQQAFPGETLEGLRRRHGESQALLGDVAALEAVEAEKRKLEQAKEQAEAIAAEAERRDAEQQAALVEPVLTAPAVELPAAELELRQFDDTVVAPDPQPVVEPQNNEIVDGPAQDSPGALEPIAEPEFMEPLAVDVQEFPAFPSAPPSP
ncbi:putative conserved membrane protein [Synechococcus sp. MEDNS5]|nr:putative conserved membrane protein [Synechococcus sp. MEDNS5]